MRPAREVAAGFFHAGMNRDALTAAIEARDAEWADRRSPAVPPEPPHYCQHGLICTGPAEDPYFDDNPPRAATPGTAPTSEPHRCHCGKPWEPGLHSRELCGRAGTPRGDE